MLAQDYLLKQLTASLIYPEKNLGRNFWDKVYAKASQLYGSTQIPVNTFNKVWILPDTAKVYEHKDTVFVVKSHLKVMLDEDYLALFKHQTPTGGHIPEGDLSPSRLLSNEALNVKASQLNNPSSSGNVNNLGSQIVREIVLPAIEQEVNTGKNFATLRQIYNSMILAVWFKKNLKEAFLNQVYTDKSKVNGVNVDDPAVKEKIYQQYIQAYKKGVFNFIKEEVDQNSRETIPRKYFSGGLTPERPENLTQATSGEFRRSVQEMPAENRNYAIKGLTQGAKRDPAKKKDGSMTATLKQNESKTFDLTNGEGITLNVGDDYLIFQHLQVEGKDIVMFNLQGKKDIHTADAKPDTDEQDKSIPRIGLHNGVRIKIYRTDNGFEIKNVGPVDITIRDVAMTAETVRKIVESFLQEDLTVEYKFSVDAEPSGRDVVVTVTQTNRVSPPLLPMTVSANYQSLVNKFPPIFHLIPMQTNDAYVLQFKTVNPAIPSTMKWTDVQGDIERWLPLAGQVVLGDINPDMFRDYDYRYVKDGVPLKPEIVFIQTLVWAKMALKKAEAAGIKTRDVLVARDARKIEPEIADAEIAALRFAGLNVVFVGDEPNCVTSYSWAVQSREWLMTIFNTASHVSQPENMIVRGFKVTQLGALGGNVLSLTTKEIKNESLALIKEILADKTGLTKMKAAEPGKLSRKSIEDEAIRFNTAVGLVAANNESLYQLGRDIKLKDANAEVGAVIDRLGSNKPLAGLKVVVEGSHTPSGP
ncbi:MAG: hypothetical protein HQL14_06205, partial [Candidatus Omnitrophica bacterium]|nr:hypothetical protein [Candidatus Omnitrophota bacterium]